MKKIATALVLTLALAAPRYAMARAVTIKTSLKQFGGYSAYIVLYLTDSRGAYVKTIWMAGGRPNYYRHLGGWLRASRGQANLNGITGASVGAGETLTVRTDLADAMIDAGYTIHADVASEGMMESARDVSAPLTSKDSGHAFSGRAYIGHFSYQM